MQCKLRRSYSSSASCYATFRGARGERAPIARRNRMKTAYCLGALTALALGATTAAHADVDISVAIQGEIAPGVYGRIDLNGRPPPPLVYAKPVIIEQPPPQ